MMAYAIKRGDEWQEISGAFQSGGGDDQVNHPSEWLDASSPQARTARGVFRIAEPDAPPVGQRIIGTRLADRDGRPARVYDLEPLSIDDAREQAWTAAKAYRDQRERAGAPTPHGFFDADVQSRGNIAGAALGALRAQLGKQPFQVTFTRWDNTSVDLDATAMGDVGDAVLLYVAQVHASGTAIRARIDAAVTAADALVIDVTAGYPPAATDQ